MCRPRAVIDDDATVGDALRGWPRHAKQLELLQAQQQAAGNDNDRDDKQKQRAKKKTSSQAAAKGGAKSKSKSNVTKEKDDEDIHVADLISQRFLHEYMEQREAEMERERKKKEAREIAAREGRRAAKDRTDIKANKAAQLRAIALADRVEATPFDLWKMDKFTHSARPHVSTFRNGQGPGGASGASPASGGFGGASDHQSRGRHGGGRGGNRNAGRYGNRGGGGSGRFSGRSSCGLDDEEDYLAEFMVGACTCPDQLPYYDGDTDVYASYHDCADGCMTQDIDDGVDCTYSYTECPN